MVLPHCDAVAIRPRRSECIKEKAQKTSDFSSMFFNGVKLVQFLAAAIGGKASGCLGPQTESVRFPHSLCEASWLSGSVRDIQVRDRGFDPRLRWICSDFVLLGKALCLHVHSLDPGVSGYLVGQWRLVCLNGSVRRKWQLGCMLPGGRGAGLRRLMNEEVLWPGVIVWSRANGASR